MRLTSESWKQFIFYGEVVGFALAWVIGVVLLTRSQSPEPRLAGVEGIAHAEISLSDLGPGGKVLE